MKVITIRKGKALVKSFIVENRLSVDSLQLQELQDRGFTVSESPHCPTDHNYLANEINNILLDLEYEMVEEEELV